MTLWFRAALTITFAISAGYCLRRCVFASGRMRMIERVNDAAHVLMSLEMIAMVWAVIVPDPIGIQIVVFGVAAVWFALQATGVPLRRAGLIPIALSQTRGTSDRPAAHCNSGEPDQRGTATRPQCVHHALLLAAMVWMLVALRPTAQTSGMSMPGPSPIIAGFIGGYCLLAGLAWLWARRGRTGMMSQVGMTVAMGVALIAMR